MTAMRDYNKPPEPPPPIPGDTEKKEPPELIHLTYESPDMTHGSWGEGPSVSDVVFEYVRVTEGLCAVCSEASTTRLRRLCAGCQALAKAMPARSAEGGDR